MVNKKDVMKALQLCYKQLNNGFMCRQCPYNDHADIERRCFEQLYVDAYEILKNEDSNKQLDDLRFQLQIAVSQLEEQKPESAKPQIRSKGCTHSFECGTCLASIDYCDRFCRNCGRPLNWMEEKHV